MSKYALITGVSSGIGKSIAQYLNQQDQYKIIGIDLNNYIGNIDVHFFKGDVSDSKFLSQVSNNLNCKIDVIINNAAIQIEKPFYETEEFEWDKVINVNLKSIYLVSKYFLNHLKPSSAIINISSVHARATSTGMAAYVASKGGVSSLTRAMALELGNKNIRVNAILPGAIDTPMLMKGLGRNSTQKESLQKLTQSSPLNKIGSGEDIAKLVSFLANNELSGNITGQEFISDSGILSRLASE